MAKIRKIYDEAIKPDGSKQVIYPITSTRAVYTPTNITVDTLLNEGYRFGGVVLPADSPTFTDQRVFYGASVPGVYPNFGGISVDGGEAIFLMYNGTEWKKGIFGGAGSNNLTGFKSLASISELPLEETTIGYLIEDSALPEGFSKQVLYVWVGENGDTLDGLYQNCGQLRGASAYESAVRNGYEGTIEEWLNDPVNGIKGNGIKSWTVDQSTADSGESTITVEFDKTPTETFKVKNGKGISSITETPSVANGGTNVIHINLSDGTSYDIDVKNGSASDGFYATATLLNTAIPSPNVGDYAFVSKAGDGTFPAYIYVCTTAGTWTNSEQEFTTEVAQVSVSQNTETGHTDINIGSDSYPVASVEEVSQLGQNNIYLMGISVSQRYNGYFDGANILNYQNSKFIVVPILGGSEIKITKGINPAYVAIAKTFDVNFSIPYVIDYATGESFRLISNSTFTAPSDARFILIRVEGNGESFIPSIFKINNIDILHGLSSLVVDSDLIADGAVTLEKINGTDIDDVPTNDSNKLVKSGGVKSAIDEQGLLWRMDNCYLGGISVSPIFNGYLNGANIVNYQNSKFVCIPISGNYIITMTKNTINSCYVSITKSFDIFYTLPYTVDYATGESLRIISNDTFTVPSDAKYLLLMVETNGESTVPSVFTINGIDMLTGLTGIVSEISSKEGENKNNLPLYASNFNQTISEIPVSSVYDNLGDVRWFKIFNNSAQKRRCQIHLKLQELSDEAFYDGFIPSQDFIQIELPYGRADLLAYKVKLFDLPENDGSNVCVYSIKPEQERRNEPVFPYVGGGKLICSRDTDCYAHDSCCINTANNVYVIYQSSSWITHESFTMCGISMLIKEKSKNINRYKRIDDHILFQKYINNELLSNSYNHFATLVGNNIIIDYSVVVDKGGANQRTAMVYRSFDTSNEILTEPNYLKLKYNGNTVDWSLPNYIAMVNSLYGYNYDTSYSPSALQINGTCKYGEKYYRVMAVNLCDEGAGVVFPFILLSSDDCITWEPVSKFYEGASSAETQISAASDKLLVAIRGNIIEGQQEGVFYCVIGLDGTILKSFERISYVDSMPNCFVYHNQLYLVYNITTTGVTYPGTAFTEFYKRYWGRVKINVAKLNNDNTLTDVLSNYSPCGWQYFSASVCGEQILISNTEDTSCIHAYDVIGSPSGPVGDITLQELVIEPTY